MVCLQVTLQRPLQVVCYPSKTLCKMPKTLCKWFANEENSMKVVCKLFASGWFGSYRTNTNPMQVVLLACQPM